MDYVSNVVYNKKVIYSSRHKQNSNPNQVANRIAEKFKNKYQYYMIYVMNEVGELWRYSIIHDRKGSIVIRKMEKNTGIVDKNDVAMIFSGNMDVVEGRLL